MGKINRTSILAGILIGIGVVINTFSENKYVGAMLFSFALLTIIKLQLQLFTGQIGYFTEKRFDIKEYIIMLLFNFIGVAMAAFLGVMTKNEAGFSKMMEISSQKFARSYIELLICGILCGALMLIAVHTKDSIIVVFCIMIFILSGYEHCVADFPFFLLNISIENGIKFLLIILGNSIGSIVTYLLMMRKQKTA